MDFKSERQLDEIHQCVMTGLLQTANIGFAHFPGVNAPEWPIHIRKLFKKHYRETKIDPSTGMPLYHHPERDWIAIDIQGTTFSGLSTRTTLGNTFRSLCYMYWYIQDGLGIENPWDSD